MLGESSGREIALRIGTAVGLGRLSEKAAQSLAKGPASTFSLGSPASQFPEEECVVVTVGLDNTASNNRIVKKRVREDWYSTPTPETAGRREVARYNFEVRKAEPEHPESNAEALRQGHNRILDALATAPNPHIVRIAGQLLDRNLYPYGTLQEAPRLTPANFRPNLPTTRLFDGTAEMLKMVLAKYEQMRAFDIETRTATLIMTDGVDNDSQIHTAKSIADVVHSMRDTKHHLVAAMGFEAGEGIHLKDLFNKMGIDPQWQLTSDATLEDILRVLGMFGKAAAQATVITDFSKMLPAGFQGLAKADPNSPAQQ